MMHIGSAKGMTQEEAIERSAKGVARVLDGYKGATELLLEISAGTGQIIGDTFEELAEIIDKSGTKGKVGVCLDSCHMFASGYDIRTKEAMTDTMKKIEKTVGKSAIKLIHANDSKIELGGHRDRHAHIGEGEIGKEGFKQLMAVFNSDFILETEHDKVKSDIKLLKQIRDDE